MKLDKTEEILQNKSHNISGEVIKEYFRLRISNDKRLATLKSVHADEKLKYKQIIKQIPLVSIQKIDFNITAYKDNVKNSDDIIDISNEVYNVIVDKFECSSKIYYENNQEHILNYIISIYKSRIEMKNLNAELCSIINIFVKDNNIKQHKLAQFVSLYQEMKKDLQFYSNYCNNIEDFKTFQSEKEELSTFVEEIFLEEICIIESKRELLKITNSVDNQRDLEYKRKVSNHYTPRIGNDSKEFVFETILNNTERTEENILEDIVTNNKEANIMMNELCKKPKKPVGEKTKTKEELAELKRKQKLYKIAMKEMGFTK